VNKHENTSKPNHQDRRPVNTPIDKKVAPDTPPSMPEPKHAPAKTELPINRR